MTNIHPTAIIDPKSQLGENVKIGPYCVIGPGVEIGDSCEILNNVTVSGPTRIGKNTKIYSYAVLGSDSQDKKYDPNHAENCRLSIGENCNIREFCTINRGSHGDHPETILGNDCHILSYSHIGHDCVLGNKVTFSNATALAGHVKIGEGVVAGGEVGIHQFMEVGDYCMLSSRALIKSNIPPYLLVNGQENATAVTINKVGLERNGIPKEDIDLIEKSFKIYYRKKDILKKEALQEIISQFSENSRVAKFIEFIQTRGNICS